MTKPVMVASHSGCAGGLRPGTAIVLTRRESPDALLEIHMAHKMPPAPKAEPNRAPTRRADPQQDAVVNASPEARLIVESGPGCGKTDVACARVAWLIDSGVPAARIVLLSFTRTAVREIRARIRQIAAATSDVAEVDVRTLDSFAGSLRTGASLGKGIARAATYDDSIKQTIVLLREGNLQLKEYLSRLRHVIVDEAQDLVGDRAELVRLLLDLLPSSCGWTVFLDPAQSIFDWSETGTRLAGGRSTFLEHIKEIGQTPGVGRRSLEKIYRASSGELLNLMQLSRRIVMQNGKRAADKIRELAFQHDTAAGAELTEQSFAKLASEVEPSTLFLFRTRAEALEASQWLTKRNVAHRLRLGGLPYAVAPWIAFVANVTAAADMSESQFDDAWRFASERHVALLAKWDHDSAWRMLRRLGWAAASKRVSCSRVAERLVQGGLPDDLSMKEIGSTGPIVGTIHGSKGREAPTVYACLRRVVDTGPESDQAEEARVIYVALTRAQVRCRVRHSAGFPMKWTDSGRAWRYENGYTIRFECGRERDVDAFGALVASENPVRQQEVLVDWSGRPVPLKGMRATDEQLRGLEKRQWRHVVMPVASTGTDSVENAIASFSQAWEDDIYKGIVREARWPYTPGPLYDLQWIDLSTVSVPADDVRLARVPEPWKTTRLWLAPIITSWARASKPKKQ